MLDKSFGSKESIIFLSEFLHELLVLVQPRWGKSQCAVRDNSRLDDHSLLQVIDAHVFEVNLLSTIDIVGVTKQADAHSGSWDVGEPGLRVKKKAKNKKWLQENP